MDYEKKYKEEVDRATQLWECGDITRENLEYIFPELKESEDERMRNVAINACKYMVENFENSTKQYEDAITWLEKQKPITNKEDEEVRQYLIRTMKRCDINVPMVKKALAWLEKQSDIGEDLIAKKYLINKGYPIDTNGTFPTYEEMYNIIREGLEKQGLQKPIDKVEPRFKVGDWIVENGVNRNPVQITSFEEDKGSGIKVWFSNGTGTYIEFLKGYHKWTIQDIKNGDILAGIYGIFIFIGESNGYCGILSDNTFIRNIGNNECTEYLHPATKEQRDLLFSKMKNAGYEWDAEKKELKKFEDEEYNEEDYGQK